MSDVDVERSVLGAVLIDSRLYKQAAELRLDDFSLDSNRRIFARMIDLVSAGRPIDILTLLEELGSHGELDAIGGATYLTSLIDGVPDRPSIQHYVGMVRTAADRRAQLNSWRERSGWRTIPAWKQPHWQRLATI